MNLFTVKFLKRYFVLDLRSILLRHSSPVLYGNVVRLHCMVDTNYQLLNYSWFKDNIILKLTDGERMQTLPSGILKIRNYKVSDNGNYSCRVNNGYKEMNSDMLSVQGQCNSYKLACVSSCTLLHDCKHVMFFFHQQLYPRAVSMFILEE